MALDRASIFLPTSVTEGKESLLILPIFLVLFFYTDVETFLCDLASESLQLSHEKKRDELLENVIELRRKLKNSAKAANGIRSPRPKRKSYPFAAVHLQDSMHTYAAHMQKVNVEGKLKPPGSPEIRRVVEKPQMRPRSVSCPEIRFTLSHAWRTSLQKVPENEELKVESDEGS